MTIKGRLILSYTAMLVVPMILLALVARLVALGPPSGEPRFAPAARPGMPAMGDRLWLRELNHALLNDPDSLAGDGFWEELETRSASPGSPTLDVPPVAVRRGRRVVYASKAVRDLLDPEELPPFGAPAPTARSGEDPCDGDSGRRKEHHTAPLLQWDFTFGDGSPGSLFFFSPMLEHPKSLPRHTGLFLLTIAILVGTNGLLTLLVSRSIIRPLDTLKRAAERITLGDLDFEVPINRKDELGEVMGAFEEMRSRLQDSLKKQIRYEESRKELIAGISHDLRTPITTIKGYVEGLRDGVAGSPEKQKKYLETIYGKAVHLDRLIEELFFFSRLDLEGVPFRMAPVDLRSFTLEICEELDAGVDSLSITVDAPAGEELTVPADRTHLHRVFSNLVDNAVRYSAGGRTEVVVALRPGTDEVAVEVRDNGPGMPEEMLSGVFGRFVRTDASRAASPSGAGLGLTIALRIVEAHGGRMWAANDGGTVVSFTLPRGPLQPDAAGEEADRGTVDGGETRG